LTPSVHLSAYDPEDNRHDERPFLYNINWPFQFGKIRDHVDSLEKKLAEKQDQSSQDKASDDDID
jgi:NAD+ synthase (glutamine-hydrolysing)